jgi:hypothetical protein
MRHIPATAIVIIALLVVFPTQAQAQQVNLGYLSMYLKEDMTEQQVISATGYLPNKVELQTCGGKTAHSWQCRIYTYGNIYYNLTIFFYQDGRGAWRVNNWYVYP